MAAANWPRRDANGINPGEPGAALRYISIRRAPSGSTASRIQVQHRRQRQITTDDPADAKPWMPPVGLAATPGLDRLHFGEQHLHLPDGDRREDEESGLEVLGVGTVQQFGWIHDRSSSSANELAVATERRADDQSGERTTRAGSSRIGRRPCGQAVSAAGLPARSQSPTCSVTLGPRSSSGPALLLTEGFMDKSPRR